MFEAIKANLDFVKENFYFFKSLYNFLEPVIHNFLKAGLFFFCLGFFGSLGGVIWEYLKKHKQARLKFISFLLICSFGFIGAMGG